MNIDRRTFLCAAAACGLAADAIAGNSEQLREATQMSENADDPKLKYVTYCGLYCKLCANMARIPKQARALRETMAKEGWEFFGKEVFSDFDAFWKGLELFSRHDQRCPGCRSGQCGYPGCEIRKCAQARKVAVCPACPEFPCAHVKKLAERYPTLIADGVRQQKIGLDAWIREQDERVDRGFCYAEIRY